MLDPAEEDGDLTGWLWTGQLMLLNHGARHGGIDSSPWDDPRAASCHLHGAGYRAPWRDP